MLMWALHASSVHSAEISPQPCWQHPFLLAGEDELLWPHLSGACVGGGLFEAECTESGYQHLLELFARLENAWCLHP